uniref:C2H2-type domain-containing protein n=1 Tax=Hippocampus comes TaxID=109280 RepID=A0A3Q2YKZ6_HIPCM
MCATLAAALPGLLAGAGGQGGIMMKPFLHFPVNNNTAAPPAPHLFPNFNAVRPNCTLGLRWQLSQAEAHYRGSRHAKKLKMQQSKEEHNEASVDAAAKDGDAGPAPSTGTSAGRSPQNVTIVWLGCVAGGSAAKPRHRPPLLFNSSLVAAEVASSSSAAGQAAPPAGEWDAERAKKLLYCSLCKVSVNSLMQLEAHNSGTKHKTMLDARSGSGPVKALPRAGAKVKSPPAGAPSKSCAPQNKTFRCGTCNIQVNSEIQLKQHIASRKHKDRLAGKPTKPKFNKSQRAHVRSWRGFFFFAVKRRESLRVAFRACFCCQEVSTSSDLTSPPPASSSGSVPHPAPGPIRASQGSALFAPY